MSDIALQPRLRAGRLRRFPLAALAVAVVMIGVLSAWPHLRGALVGVPQLNDLFTKLHADPVLIEALREQNAALAGKDRAWALEQDRAWTAERGAGGGPLQRAVMERAASAHLRAIIAASDGLIGHAFLIDAAGRMAATPFISFNFLQADKPKFHYTFVLGANARDVSWLQSSWDGDHPACWRAETMADPRTGAPIGVLALEVNYLKVGYFGCRETPLHSAAERATNHVDSQAPPEG